MSESPLERMTKTSLGLERPSSSGGPKTKPMMGFCFTCRSRWVRLSSRRRGRSSMPSAGAGLPCSKVWASTSILTTAGVSSGPGRAGSSGSGDGSGTCGSAPPPLAVSPPSSLGACGVASGLGRSDGKGKEPSSVNGTCKLGSTGVVLSARRAASAKIASARVRPSATISDGTESGALVVKAAWLTSDSRAFMISHCSHAIQSVPEASVIVRPRGMIGGAGRTPT